MLTTRELKAVFRRNQVAEDPNTVTLTVRAPGGSSTVYSYPGTLERLSAGVFRVAAHTPTVKGTHACVWECTYNGPPVVQGRRVDSFFAADD